MPRTSTASRDRPQPRSRHPAWAAPPEGRRGRGAAALPRGLRGHSFAASARVSGPLRVIDGTALSRLPAPLQGLALHPRFVVWDPQEINEKGAQVKSPRRPDNPARWASTRRPDTWGSWAAVQAIQQTDPGLRAGYVLTQDQQHVFLDLDGCRDPETGVVDPWAQTILTNCHSYVEITPSGRGLRVVGLAEPDTRPIMEVIPASLLGGPAAGQRPHGKDPQIEVYFNTPRYVTVTGWRLDGTQDWPLAPISQEARRLADLAPPRQDRAPNPIAELPDGDLSACVAAMPNPPVGEPDTWETFNTAAMAIFAASGGSPHGLACLVHWSAKNPKHDPVECLDRWDHWQHSSPPDILTGGTLIHHARLQAAQLGTTLQIPSRLSPPGGWPPLDTVSAPPESSDVQPAAAADPGRLAAPALDDVEKPGVVEPPYDPLLAGLPPPLIPIAPFAPPVPAAAPQPLFDLLSPRQLMARYGEAPDFLIDGLLTRGSTVLLTGLPGAGKSPFAQDLAVRVAIGAGWRGHAGQKGRVVYVAAESARQTTLNLAHLAAGVIEEATALDHGTLTIEDGLTEIEDTILAIDNNLTLEHDVERLILTLQGAVADGGPWAGQPIDLITLDTLRAMSSGSVSSDEDMQVVQAAVARLREAFPLSVVLVLHHAAKGAPAGSSGSNRLDGMAETILAMTMLPRGQDIDCETMLTRSDQWGPDLKGWRYMGFKLTMGRNKTWETMEPSLVLMAVQGSMVRLCYDGRNPTIADAAKTCLGAAQGVFSDSRKTKTVGTPVGPSAQPGDDGAFAGGQQVKASAKAQNVGTAAVDVLVLGRLQGGPATVAELADWLLTVPDIAEPDIGTLAGVGLDRAEQRRRINDRLRKLAGRGKTQAKESVGRNSSVWSVL